MTRLNLLTAAGAAMLLTGAGSVRAATVVYGYNTSPTGYTVAYDGSDNGDATISQSTTTGVTEGTGALHIHTGTAAGYTQTDIFGPADGSAAAFGAPGTTSFNLDLTFNPGAVAYAYIAPNFFLEGGSYNGGPNVDRKLSPVTSAAAFANVAHLEGNTYSGTTLTYNLKVYKDPYGATDGNGTVNLYTPAEIVAAVNAFSPGSLATIDRIDFQEINGASAGLDYYIDNVTVAAVPEPVSLGMLTAGGMLLLRRRTR